MDVLKDVPDSDIPKLIEIYEKHIDWAPHAHSFLNTALRWKKSPKYRECIRVMSPDDSWKVDGTFIALLQFSSYDLFMFTLDKNCTNLCRALSQTKKIDFTRPNLLLFCLHNDFLPKVEKCILQERHLKYKLTAPTVMFSISREGAMNFDTECPPEAYVKKLDTSHAKQVNNAWPHRYPGSENYISTLIEMNGGFGVFLKSTHEMVSWIIVHCLGHLGMVQTEDNFKKMGYGSLVTKVLAKKLAQEDGFVPFGTVIVGNEPSIGMFKKLGFKDIGLSTYFICEPANTN